MSDERYVLVDIQSRRIYRLDDEIEDYLHHVWILKSFRPTMKISDVNTLMSSWIDGTVTVQDRREPTIFRKFNPGHFGCVIEDWTGREDAPPTTYEVTAEPIKPLSERKALDKEKY